MNESQISLGKFLKKENWGFHFAFLFDPEPSWISLFRDTCKDSQLDADVKSGIYYESGKQNQFFAVVTGGLEFSESQARSELEKAISKTNKKFSLSAQAA